MPFGGEYGWENPDHDNPDLYRVVTNAFRRGVRLGDGRRKLLIRKPRDPD